MIGTLGPVPTYSMPNDSNPPAGQKTKPWYERAFEAEYVEVYAHRDLPAARSEVRWLREQGIAGATLDLCCGFGRHSLALSEGGAFVVGLDLSMDLLQRSSRLPGAEKIKGRLVRGDMRRLPFARESFDSVVNLFSSFGYFGEAHDAHVLSEISRVLRPGGHFVLDLMNPARIRRHLVPESRTERGGYVLYESRELVEEGARVVKRVRLVAPDGSEKAWKEDVRMYEPAVIQALLTAQGLRVEATFGGFDGAAFDSDSTRQLIIGVAE